ncbi:hypothetical protein M0802_009456 [Mischocyttarus mexicanus]|nr:hypothetical protein M0802_009456 [Mischocyttarus mexicanus]
MAPRFERPSSHGTTTIPETTTTITTNSGIAHRIQAINLWVLTRNRLSPCQPPPPPSTNSPTQLGAIVLLETPRQLPRASNAENDDENDDEDDDHEIRGRRRGPGGAEGGRRREKNLSFFNKAIADLAKPSRKSTTTKTRMTMKDLEKGAAGAL